MKKIKITAGAITHRGGLAYDGDIMSVPDDISARSADYLVREGYAEVYVGEVNKEPVKKKAAKKKAIKKAAPKKDK